VWKRTPPWGAKVKGRDRGLEVGIKWDKLDYSSYLQFVRWNLNLEIDIHNLYLEIEIHWAYMLASAELPNIKNDKLRIMKWNYIKILLSISII
jgi:hypothetical protein